LADEMRKISLETRETEFRIGTENRGQFRLSPDYSLSAFALGLGYPPRSRNGGETWGTRRKPEGQLLS